MPASRIYFLTALALVAFAGNSILCRLALGAQRIDPLSFTTLRLASGAFVLATLCSLRDRRVTAGGGDWRSAGALFLYALPFSMAYTRLQTGTGALILFAAVQVTMLAAALREGERFVPAQWVGMLAAAAGLLYLLAPGGAPPSWAGALTMGVAGVAWGWYTLLGRGAGEPLSRTAGNFIRATPLMAVVMLAGWGRAEVTPAGAGWAIASGALTSGIGYAIWYAALPGLKTSSAAAVQLAVPALAAAGGILLLGEPLTLRFVVASALTLGGIALVLRLR
ncbi:MAG: DMT family transporter [Rhodothermales bacterium]